MEPIDGTIELKIPADARMLRLVRMLASGLATGAGFDVDELDDLRIAVDEAVSALLEGGGGEPLPLVFEVRGGSVEMSGETPGGGNGALDEDRLELSTQILAAVCDDHELTADGGAIRVRICRRAGAH